MTLRLAHIFRYPIKGHGREELASVALSPGRTLPWDRHWAVAHDAARIEPGEWARCLNFMRGAKAPMLMAITARLDEPVRRVTLSHPDRPDHSFRPDDPAELPGFLDWVAPLCPPGRSQPAALVAAPGGRGMTDSPYPSVSVLSLNSLRALEQRMGRPLGMHRWRANLWLEGLAPWEEFDLIGREIAIGPARLRVKERITRCKATTANPETGRIDADTLGALNEACGHQDFGVYATILEGGTLTPGDELRL